MRTEHSPLRRATVTATVALVGAGLALGVLVSSRARRRTAPWWRLSLSSAPTDLQPGTGEALRDRDGEQRRRRPDQQGP